MSTAVPKRVTIKQIAQLAGVSVSTVSRVINGSQLVDEETRQRVQAVIREQNYIPNRLAQGLVRQHSRTVALILPDIANPFFSDIIHGVEDALVPRGYSMYLCNSNFNHDRESQFLEEMAERQAEGAIIISAFLQNVPQIQRLNQSTMRIVGIHTQIEGIDRVNTTDYQGMSSATAHLLELGHRRIAFLCIDLRGCRPRYKAYCDQLEKNGVEVDPAYVREGIREAYTPNPGYLLTKALLELPKPPTAIQTLNDHLAYGAYKAIFEKGLRVPEDISVVGYDDLPLSQLLQPPLTSVHQPAYEMGEAGAELLLKDLGQGERRGPCREVLFDTRLVVRGSTGPAREG